jgi:hypothetical protein
MRTGKPMRAASAEAREGLVQSSSCGIGSPNGASAALLAGSDNKRGGPNRTSREALSSWGERARFEARVPSCRWASARKADAAVLAWPRAMTAESSAS